MQNSKKRYRSQQKNRPAIKVNATKVIKKEKDKAKDLSYVKCYIYKQKSDYANKCPEKLKKLVAVMATSMSMTGKKTKEEELEQVPYIWYSITFKDQTEALLDFESKVNTMNPAFAS